MLNANSIGKGSKLDLFKKFIHNFCHCPKELPLAFTTALLPQEADTVILVQ